MSQDCHVIPLFINLTGWPWTWYLPAPLLRPEMTGTCRHPWVMITASPSSSSSPWNLNCAAGTVLGLWQTWAGSVEYLLSPADPPLSPASPTFVKIDEPVSTYCKLRSRVHVRFEVIFFFRCPFCRFWQIRNAIYLILELHGKFTSLKIPILAFPYFKLQASASLFYSFSLFRMAVTAA